MNKFKLSFLVLLLMALGSIHAVADDFASNDIYYSEINDTEVTVTGGWLDSGVLNIPEHVVYQGIVYSVTSISENAFSHNDDLLIVSIPNSVTNIGAEAFYECTNLSSITFGNSMIHIDNDAFYGCNCLTSVKISDIESWLNFRFENNTANPLYYAHRLFINGVEETNLVVPETITEIGDFAFVNCTGLQSVSLPNSIESIGGGAFDGCHSLTSVHITDLVAWCLIDFSYGDSNPLYYAHRLFLNGTELTDLVIPESITEIGKGAFRSCSSLKTLTLHNSVTSIGAAAFGECTGLTSIVIPTSVTTMGRSAFQLCTGLTHLVFNAPEIGYMAFKQCSALTNVIINNSVTKIGGQAFDECTSLTNVTIPSSVTSIGLYAFSGCTNLTSINVASDNPKFDSRNNCNSIIETASNTLIMGCKNSTIPNSVTTIGDYAFWSCNGLTNITIPNSVATIGAGAFERCTTLSSVTIPNSVRNIGSSAFSGCTGLTDVYSYIEKPSTVTTSSSVFYLYSANYSERTLHVPNGTSNAYRANGNWYPYFDNIVEMNPVTAASIELNQTSAELTEGETLRLIATVLPDSTTNKVVNWISSSENVASVDSTGLVSAHELGLTIITVRTTDGSNLSATCSITVTPQPILATSISLNKTTAEITEGKTLQLTATVLPSNADNKTVTWTSSNNSVATVNNDGLVTAIAPGSAIITATTTDGSNLSASCSMTVNQLIVLASSISLNKTNATLTEGNTLQLTATVLPSNTANKAVIWSTSNSSVANVDANGLVTAVSLGNAVIVATTTDGSNLAASCAVTVEPRVLATSIELNKTSTELICGGDYGRLTATVLPENTTNKTVTWSTSNSSVVTVNSYGYITGKATGTATITATTTDGSNLSASCTITVKPAPITNDCIFIRDFDITENQLGTEIEVHVGATADALFSAYQFELMLPEGLEVTDFWNGADATVSYYNYRGRLVSSNPSLGSNEALTKFLAAFTQNEYYQDENGSWMPAGAIMWRPGTYEDICVLTIAVDENFNGGDINVVSKLACEATPIGEIVPSNFETVTTIVTVNRKLATSIQLNQTSAEMTEGETLQLTATVMPEDATNKTVNWTSDNPAVATVDTNGLVTAVAPGNATITATTTDGSNLSAWCNVTVIEQPFNYDNYLSMNDVSAYHGDPVTIPVLMNNTEDIMAFQTVLYLPDGFTLATDEDDEPIVTPSSRLTDDHLIMADRLNDGGVRIMCYNMSEQFISGNEGELFYITVNTPVEAEGDYPIYLRNTRLTLSDYSEIQAPDVSAVLTIQTVYVPDYDNCLSMNDASVYHGDAITIPVLMDNTREIMAFQTVLYLPDGFTLATDEDDEFLITPSSRLTSDHYIMADRLNDGGVRIICYTASEQFISGNEGELFYITVVTPADAVGEHTIYLRDTRLTLANYREIRSPEASAVLTMITYTPGDVNDSRAVNVTDVVFTAQYILQRNPSPFIFEAADMNGDGEITVTDIMLIARLILYPTMNAPLRAPALVVNNDFMSGTDVALIPGETRKVSIQLDNEMDYSAFQLDLKLPAGMTASNFELTDRASSHALDVETLLDGKTRVLCYSPAIETITGKSGALLTFDVTATVPIVGDITVEGIEMVTTDCQTMHLDAFTISVNNNATAINEVASGKTIARVDYFNVAGQQIDRPRDGVTLVVTTYTDGTRTATKLFQH